MAVDGSRSRFRNLAAALALAMAALASGAFADTSSIRFIPADCQIVFHIDMEKIVGDDVFGPLVVQTANFFRAQGLPFYIRDYTSISVGVAFPPNFAVMNIMSGNVPEGVSFHLAMVAKFPAENLEQSLGQGGFAPRDVNGRPMLVAYDDSFAFSISNDKKTILGANSSANIEKMIAAYSGANAASIPGFGSNATSDSIFYVFGSNLDRLLAQLVPLAALGIAAQATTQPQREAAIKFQQEANAFGKIQAIEINVGLTTQEVTASLRVATPSPADAANLVSALQALQNFGKAMQPLAAGAPTPTPEIQGAVVVGSGSAPKQLVAQGMLQGVQAGMAAARRP